MLLLCLVRKFGHKNSINLFTVHPVLPLTHSVVVVAVAEFQIQMKFWSKVLQIKFAKKEENETQPNLVAVSFRDIKTKIDFVYIE